MITPTLRCQLITAPPGSLWLISCTVDDAGGLVTHTDALARRLPTDLDDISEALFELLLLGERLLVDIDQIHAATAATLILNRHIPPGQPRLRLVKQ